MGDAVGLDAGEDDAEGEVEGAEEEGFGWVEEGGEEVGAVVDKPNCCASAEKQEESDV